MIEELYNVYDEAYDYYTKKRRFNPDRAHDFATACVSTFDTKGLVEELEENSYSKSQS